MLWCHEVLWDEKQRYFGQLHHLEHRLELLAKKRQDLIGVKSHPNTINWPKICLVLLVSHWNMAISKISFLGFPDLTGGRWYQVLDLFAQDLRRTDVVTFNCAVASCEEIRFTFWGSFCCGNSGLGQQTFFFFFGFRRCMSFHGSLAWVWLVQQRKRGNCPYPEFPPYFFLFEESQEVTGWSVLCSNPIAHRSFQGGQLRWSYCCCVQRTEG